ncbi:MAG TPA: CPBP family intramembrane glutamic endopeptidase, partial [Steroidobacteraceae bacterium]|nr:CPBP family intramembrane glutamic endopeptidase [Steroidobacteraceae bacterium]
MIAPGFQRLVIGPDRKLRMLWRAVIFFALAYWVLPLALDPAFDFVAQRLHLAAGLTAANVALGESENFIIALICTAIFARYERRRVDSYGLPVAGAFGARSGEGALAGIVMAGAVAAAMYLLGGMHIDGLATAGSALALSALAWLGANICVGVAEEFWFRSYFLQALWKSIGFWPASIVIALIFAADHYFFKTGENIWDVITLVSLSLMMCYSVLRTGTLWFAVGFHIA